VLDAALTSPSRAAAQEKSEKGEKGEKKKKDKARSPP
jgi:hypothetical protein